MPRVNPSILTWARETAGLGLEEAARRIALNDARGVSGTERLRELEVGEVQPSRALLTRMAQQYRRPLLAFYLAEPPRSGDRGLDFRTLPQDPPPGTEAILDTLLRGLRAKQALLRAALEDEEEARPLSFVGSLSVAAGLPRMVGALRELTGVTTDEFRRQPDPDSAFDLLRDRIERAGVYVLLVGNLGSHHSSLGTDTFRGFALADPVAPFIVVNDNDARIAWSFTLLHELTHILLGATGVSGGTPDQGIERFCNDAASGFLLSEGELVGVPWPVAGDLEALSTAIGEFAQPRRISRQLVAYRLLRSGSISQTTWVALQERFHEEWQAERSRRAERNAEEPGGPNYYVVRRHRLGRSLLETVSQMMSTGALTTTRAGRILGVRPGQVAALLAGIGLSGSVGGRV